MADRFVPRDERCAAARHDTTSFTCGNAALDRDVQTTIARDEQQHTAVASVLVDPADPSPVLGYLALNSFAFARGPARRRDRERSLGGYDPVPAVRIGRLALDQSDPGRTPPPLLSTRHLRRVAGTWMGSVGMGHVAAVADPIAT